MLVPLPIVVVGIAVAAVLGVIGGWILGSASATKAHQAAVKAPEKAKQPSAVASSQADPLQEAWDSLQEPRIAVCWRLDGGDTWRRTHGQQTVEKFFVDVTEVVVGSLPDSACVQPVGEEAIAVLTGDETDVVAAANAIRKSVFRLPDGTEALVSAGFGFASGGEESLQVYIGRAFAACSEAGRIRRGSVGEWSPTGIRHVRPVGGST